MKLFQILACALFLLLSATVVGAADSGLPEIETQAAVEIPVPAEASEETEAEAQPDCDPADAMFQSEWMQPVAGGNFCGSCSSSNCNGAFRGQPCWTGSGWGHCNIYSGGFRCPAGGWDCDCGVGPLP